MDNNIWYSYDKVMSYNAMMNYILGERGVGKSYGLKKYLLNRFKKKGQSVHLLA
jgi:Podovirus DNA encapsidation protein (Gp16).